MSEEFLPTGYAYRDPEQEKHCEYWFPHNDLFDQESVLECDRIAEKYWKVAEKYRKGLWKGLPIKDINTDYIELVIPFLEGELEEDSLFVYDVESKLEEFKKELEKRR